MNPRRVVTVIHPRLFFRRRVYAAATIGLALGVASGCNGKGAAAAKSPAPAKVETIAQEAKLNTIVLTAEAEKRLGIETVAVGRPAVERRRTPSGGAAP